MSGAGDDKVFGGEGDDLIIQNGSGTQEYDGGTGNDTLEVDTSFVTQLNPNFTNKIEINLFDGEMGQVGNSNLRDKIENIENVTFKSDFDAIITGDNNDNIIIGGSGDDTLTGGIGNDTLMSGAGDDKVFGGDGDDVLILNGSGTQEYDGGDGIDTFKIDHLNWTSTLNPEYDQIIEIDLANNISGQKGNPSLRDKLFNIENITYKGYTDVEMTGNSLSNIIRSAAGDDVINAGDGNDFINSGMGYDLITSGSGLDLILIRPEQSSNTIATTKTITDFVKGEDKLALNGLNYEDISINQGTGDYLSHTILSTTGQSGISYLGVLKNIDASNIDVNDFIQDPFSKKDFTTSIEKWGGGPSSWLDGPVIKLHSKDNGVVSETGIDLTSKAGFPGHKHKPDVDKGTYELRVEHNQNTDGAINIDDVMGVLSLSRGITQTTSEEHKLAADWNGDGLINIDDVMGVLSRSRGIEKNDEWRFYDKSSNTSLWDNASKKNKMDIVLEDDKDIELSAILRGDVNGSYKADQHDRAAASAPTSNPAPLPLNNDDELLTINPDIV